MLRQTPQMATNSMQTPSTRMSDINLVILGLSLVVRRVFNYREDWVLTISKFYLWSCSISERSNLYYSSIIKSILLGWWRKFTRQSSRIYFCRLSWHHCKETKAVSNGIVRSSNRNAFIDVETFFCLLEIPDPNELNKLISQIYRTGRNSEAMMFD